VLGGRQGSADRAHKCTADAMSRSFFLHQENKRNQYMLLARSKLGRRDICIPCTTFRRRSAMFKKEAMNIFEDLIVFFGKRSKLKSSRPEKPCCKKTQQVSNSKSPTGSTCAWAGADTAYRAPTFSAPLRSLHYTHPSIK